MIDLLEGFRLESENRDPLWAYLSIVCMIYNWYVLVGLLLWVGGCYDL